MDVFAYSIGYQNGYEDAKREFGITWHSFPEEKPQEDKEVLIVYKEHELKKMAVAHMSSLDYFHFGYFLIEATRVIKWAELPKGE